MTDLADPTGVIGEHERDVVFVSYARSNGRTIAPLVAELRSTGTRLWLDVEDIRPATEWIHEVRAGITNARAFLAVLSPEYIASSACVEELEFARGSGKAIVPVALGDPKDISVPPWLAALHWITWQPGTDAADTAAAVATAVSTDVRWSDLHSQLQARATDWSRRNRTTSDLLRGSELDEAERALAVTRPVGQPFPTTLQREYVVSGRAQQRRFTRRVIFAVSSVAVLSLLLGGLAIWQGVSATRAAEEARQALARSDFERFRAAASESPDLVRRARLSLAAHAAADRGALAPASSARPLLEAFGNVVDVPVARFDIRPEDQGYSGDHEGVAVSGDGSTMAYLGLDGVLHVVDMWTLDERVLFSPAEWSDHLLPQIALSFDGARLLYAAGARDSNGVLREYDVSKASPTVEVEEAMPFGDLLAAVAFGPQPETYTLVRVSGEILSVKLAGNEPDVVVLGDHADRSNAGAMLVTFSHDANRVCVTGDMQALYQLSAPQLISAGSHLTNCVPEPCSGSVGNHFELDDKGGGSCVTPEGAVVNSVSDCKVCTRQARVSDKAGLGYRALVPGPDGEQIIEWGAGLLSITRL